MAVIPRAALPARPAPGKARAGRIAVLAGGALLVMVALLQVNQFSRLTSTGYEIERLERERAEKQAINHQLEAEVAGLSSLARVDWEARTRLKMEPAKRKLQIAVNVPAPDRQSLPSRFLPAPEVAPVDAGADPSPPLWKRMLDALPF